MTQHDERDTSFFLAIEGIDGSGKSTQARLVVEYLQGKGLDAERVQPVSSPDIDRAIRNRLSGRVDKKEESTALLFAADRFEMFDEKVRPVLDRGGIAVCDRYLLSSFVYQVTKRVTIPWLQDINKHVPMPQGRIVLDVTPEVAVERVGMRDTTRDQYESIDFLKSARARYLNHPHECRHKVLDATRGESQVTRGIISTLAEWGVEI